MTNVAAIVVTYNSADKLTTCLSSVQAQEMPAGDTLRCIVVDNASKDRSAQLARSVLGPDNVVVSPQNAGFAAALNVGAAIAGEVDGLLVLNADTELGSTVVRELVTASGHPGVGITVPVITNQDGRIEHTLRRHPSAWRAWVRAFTGSMLSSRWPWLDESISVHDAYTQPSRAAWATGAAMYITRSCWDAVGGFDETFFLYSEETDFALRAAQAGFALELAPATTVVHVGGARKVMADLWALLIVNRVLHHRRYAGAVAGSAMYAAMLANELLRLPLASRHRRAALELLRGPRRRRTAIIQRLQSTKA